MANHNSMQELDGKQNNNLLSSSTSAFSQVASLHFKTVLVILLTKTNVQFHKILILTPQKLLGLYKEKCMMLIGMGGVPSIGSKVWAVSGPTQSDRCKHKTSKGCQNVTRNFA